MRTIPSSRAVLFLILLAATPLLGQEQCEPMETMDQCFQRHLAEDFYLKRVKAREWNELQSQPTGVDTGGADVATNKKDFNPLMAIAGLLGTHTDGAGETTGTMVFNLNLPPNGAKHLQLQGLVNTQPQISELIRNAIPADLRDDRVGQLEKKIEGLADHTIRLTYNFMGRFMGLSHGRSFERYEGAFELMCDAALQRDLNWKLDDDEATETTPLKDMPPLMAARTSLLMEEEIHQLMELQDRALKEGSATRSSVLMSSR
jgi:hypothetical protein